MNIWKRSFLYLIRKKGRSLILISILVVMSNFILAGLALKSSVDIEEEKIRSSLGSRFKIKSDVSNPDNYLQIDDGISKGSMYNGASVTEEMIDKILAIEGVVDCFVDYHTAAWVDLILRPAMYTEDVKWYNEHPEYKDEEEGIFTLEHSRMESQVATIVPCEKGELQPYFRSGACTLVEGRSLQVGDENKVVISTRQAKRNNLKVGDTFIIEMRNALFVIPGDPLKREGDPIEVEIIGLFDIHFEQEYSIYEPELEYIENVIFADWTTAKSLDEYVEGESIEGYMDVAFFVDNPENVDTIIRQIEQREDIGLKDMIIEPDDSEYKASLKPLKQINGLALVLMISGLAGCILILYFFSDMWVKSRKKEMQILLVVGSSPKEIMLQMLLEYIMIAVIAMSITFMMSDFIINGIFGMIDQVLMSKVEGQAFVLESVAGNLIPNINKATPDKITLNYHLTLGIALTLAVAVTGTLGISITAASKRMLKSISVNMIRMN